MDVDRLIRWLWGCSTAGVAAIAFVQSYSHIYTLAMLHGESGTNARLLPLSVDGLIVAATLAMIHAALGAQDRDTGYWLTWGMLVLGIAATVAGNIGYGWGAGAIGMIISAWPAVAFLGSVGIAERKIHKARTPVVPAVPEGGNGEDHVVVAIRQEFADDLARGRVPRVTDIKARIGVGTARASAARKVLLASLSAEAVAA